MTTPNRPPLSPAAQAVMDAYLEAPWDNRLSVAAALRAAADQVIEEVSPIEALNAIANELEARP
jgi:hypothetical protein